MKKSAISLMVFFIPMLIMAQPGTLDNSFDSDGMVTVPLTGGTYGINSVKVQSDGKIVAAGTSGSGSYYHFQLCRFNPDGTLDNGFGVGGIVTDWIDSDMSLANDIAIQNDGKIVLVGQSTGGVSPDFAVVRYNSDGSPDNTFDLDGKITTDFGSSEGANSVIIQTDGKIIVTGSYDNGSSTSFAMARYTVDGYLDVTFGTGGKVVTSASLTYSSSLQLALQSDGKIVLVGVAENGGQNDFAVVRYNTNGSLDNSFDFDGMTTIDFGGNDDGGLSVILQTDGKIVIAGTSAGNFALTRLNPDGSLDNAFNFDGKLTTDLGGNDNGYSVKIQSDNKIVVAGTLGNANSDFAIARYNPDGSLDISFDSDGIVVTDIGGSTDKGRSLAIQNDGKLVVAGSSHDGSYHRFAVARYISGASGVGFEDDNFLSEIKLSPNPTSNILNLYFGMQISVGHISLLDINGKVIKTLSDFKMINFISLDVSFLAPGTYFLQVYSKEYNSTFVKFVKN